MKMSSELFDYVQDIIEMDFYNDFSALEDTTQQCLIEELQHFIQGINPCPIFINNVSCILAGEWGAFCNSALRIIDYLGYIAENDKEKIKEIFAILQLGHYSDLIDLSFFKQFIKLDSQQQQDIMCEFQKVAQGQEGAYMMMKNIKSFLLNDRKGSSEESHIVLCILEFLSDSHPEKIHDWVATNNLNPSENILF